MINSDMIKVGAPTTHFITEFRKFFPNIKKLNDTEELIDIDLMIFSGGEDIDPGIYGQSNKYCHSKNIARDLIEITFLEACLINGIKILGVCRGHQLINAYLGGTLYQDIQAETGKKHSAYHSITVESNSMVGKSFLTREVNSAHHQAVKNTGSGLIITSEHNKIIESTSGKNIETVQFHPEWLFNEDAERYFKNIIRWCKNA